MRAMSDYIMMKRQYPGCKAYPSRVCPHINSTFLEIISEELYDSSRPLKCFFNSTVCFSPLCIGPFWNVLVGLR
jgi:hypothetical protein